MSHTYCHRCKRMMAAALMACPRCGAVQDEASRAESSRRDRVTWLAIGVGVALGLAVGWAVGGTEPLVIGAVLGALVGRAVVALRC